MQTPPEMPAAAAPSVALVVHACDRYAFLYQGFAHFFAQHWDFSIPCRLYFATEELEVEVAGFENIRSGKGAWADRLALLLREKIREPYVLYFQEDMWLTGPVNGRFFTELFEHTLSNRWKQVKLHSANVYKTVPTRLFIEGFNVARLDNAASGFLMSHQVTLWEKNFLLAQLHKNEHPWRNERKGTKRLRTLNPEIFHIDYFAESGHPEINGNQQPKGRSGYEAVSMNGRLKDNIPPFIEALRGGNADARAYAERLAHHHAHRLTHDGRAEPRKTDPFKRLKNWLKKIG